METATNESHAGVLAARCQIANWSNINVSWRTITILFTVIVIDVFIVLLQASNIPSQVKYEQLCSFRCKIPVQFELSNLSYAVTSRAVIGFFDTPLNADWLATL